MLVRVAILRRCYWESEAVMMGKDRSLTRAAQWTHRR